MNKIEKMRQEIERLKTIQLKRIQEGDLVDAEPYDKNEAYNELLDFIDTLSEEPDKTLEEAADEYSNENEYMEVGFCVEPIYIGHKTEKAFIAGAKWQAEQDDRDVVFWKGMQHAVEEMKRDAVEGVIMGDIGSQEHEPHEIYVESMPLPLNGKWKMGDKVKLINYWYQKYLSLKAEMDKMKAEAVEGRVFMSFAPGHNQMVMADVDLPTNTNVRIIVLPKED